MNILPKKSWHVLSRDNVKRVRDDEAKAREKEKELARRAALAEQEARIDFMRKRARGSDDNEEERTKQKKTAEEKPMTGGDQPKHINFFSDLQTGIGLEGAVNKEHEQEKKAEQEKWEKRVGVLNYLVDKDSSSSDPWYLKSKPKDDKSLKSHEKRSILDPLEEMKGYLKTKKKSSDSTYPSELSSGTAKQISSSIRDDEVVSSDKHKKKKKKNKKEDKKEKERMLKKLREDRKRREEAERVRTEKLLKRHYGLEEEVVPKTIEEIPGRYNSQYNPHLARNK